MWGTSSSAPEIPIPTATAVGRGPPHPVRRQLRLFPGEIEGDGRPRGADRTACWRTPPPCRDHAPEASGRGRQGRTQDEGAEARGGRGARVPLRAVAGDQGPCVGA